MIPDSCDERRTVAGKKRVSAQQNAAPSDASSSVRGARPNFVPIGERVGPTVAVVGRVFEVVSATKAPRVSKGGWLRLRCDCAFEFTASASTIFGELRSGRPTKIRDVQCRSSTCSIRLEREPELALRRGWEKVRANAKRVGREVTITFEQYVSVRRDARCFYCADPLRPGSAGLDRVDNARGYHADNVVACCPMCNDARGHLISVEEFHAAMSIRIASLDFGEGPWDRFRWRSALDGSKRERQKRQKARAA